MYTIMSYLPVAVAVLAIAVTLAWTWCGRSPRPRGDAVEPAKLPPAPIAIVPDAVNYHFTRKCNYE